LFLSGIDISFDIGTSNIRVYIADKGIVINEKTIVAVEKSLNKIVAIGDSAIEMLDSDQSDYSIIRPFKDGFIASYEILLFIFKYLINTVCRKNILIRPRIAICVPTKITSAEKRIFVEGTIEAGAKQVYLIEKPIAIAIDRELDVSQPIGNMIVDIGGGVTSVSIMSFGGIMTSQSIKIAGEDCDDEIIKYIRKKYNFVIGKRTAQYAKETIGEIYVKGRVFENKSIEVRGKDIETGLPKTEIITSEDIATALNERVDMIIEFVKEVIEKTPDEFMLYLKNSGIIMAGGGSLLKGLDYLMAEETGIPVCTAEEPITCAVKGAGKLLKKLNGSNSSNVITNVPY